MHLDHKRLEETVAALLLIVKELKEENAALKKEIAELKERLNINSSNSSLSPSQDKKKNPDDYKYFL